MKITFLSSNPRRLRDVGSSVSCHVGPSLALCLLLGSGGCQGELKLTNGPPPQIVDLRPPENPVPPLISFATINKDLDPTPGLNCTSPVTGCHGAPMPTGKMALLDMAQQDMTRLMANYDEVKTRVNTATPADSVLLLKLLAPSAGGSGHVGGVYFMDKNAAMYKRWLAWITVGAKFEEVASSSTHTGDLTGGGM